MDFDKGRRGPRQGQVTIEYAVMFTIIVGVVIVAGWRIIRPSVNRLMMGTSTAINQSAQEIQDRY